MAVTHKDRVLDWLKNNKYLTVLDGIRYLGTTEVRHYVAQLRSDGHNIQSEFVKDKKTGQMYKRYWLGKESKK